MSLWDGKLSTTLLSYGTIMRYTVLHGWEHQDEYHNDIYASIHSIRILVCTSGKESFLFQTVCLVSRSLTQPVFTVSWLHWFFLYLAHCVHSSIGVCLGRYKNIEARMEEKLGGDRQRESQWDLCSLQSVPALAHLNNPPSSNRWLSQNKLRDADQWLASNMEGMLCLSQGQYNSRRSVLILQGLKSYCQGQTQIKLMHTSSLRLWEFRLSFRAM